MFYDIRIEPKQTLKQEEMIKRIKKAFEDVGLWEEPEIINID